MADTRIIEKETLEKVEKPKKKSSLTPKMRAGLKYTLTNHKNVYDALKDR